MNSPGLEYAFTGLKHAILPKTYVQRAFPGIKNRWECYGVPELVIVECRWECDPWRRAGERGLFPELWQELSAVLSTYTLAAYPILCPPG
jgi:hypothetical protein